MGSREMDNIDPIGSITDVSHFLRLVPKKSNADSHHQHYVKGNAKIP
tara:strand:- start:20 stop:160 length:141 start_codon:yes stop_codon:yes gene_type:complete